MSERFSSVCELRSDAPQGKGRIATQYVLLMQQSLSLKNELNKYRDEVVEKLRSGEITREPWAARNFPSNEDIMQFELAACRKVKERE